MKNIHILPTDKPSRLHTYFNLPNYLLLSNKALNWKEAKHIYIISDERIERGDWLFDAENEEHIYRASDVDLSNIRSLKSWYCKKIILTTDQDLIKYGVQAINDEFLEWFVKNPSCDSVEILEAPKLVKMIDNEFYKIIIPKEEDFKHELHVMSKEEVMANRSNAYEFIDFDKQEILEELAIQKRNELGLKGTIDGFIAGFEIAKERMYSDEEVSESVDMLQKCKEYFLLKTDLKSEERADAIGQVLEKFKKK